MRIRKRSGPLGFSSISTTAPSYSSDPPLISTKKIEEVEEEKKRLHPSFGDEHQPSGQVHQTSKTSSDLELTFIRGKNGWVCCRDDEDNRGLVLEEKDECMMNTNPNPSHQMEEMNQELKGLEDEKMMMMIRSSTTAATKNRRSNSLGGDDDEEEDIDFGSGVPPCSSNISSHYHDPHRVVLLHEMWCEGILKGFPMKKRRGSNRERKVPGDEETRAMTTKTEVIEQKKIMETATNDSQDQDGAKKNEEGSRCSRVNGRGWRCYQQAVVGFSLCEHHSSKRRLFRSKNSVRNLPTAAATAVAKPITNLETRVSSEKSTSATMMSIENKKRKKTGMVKARSISSLLGQTQVHDDYVKV